MHTETLTLINPERWQQLLTNAVSDPKTLFQRLQLPLQLLPDAMAAAKGFQLRVPEPYLHRIEPGNLNDPLLLQVLPRAQELQSVTGYSTDPLGEEQANQQPGVIHKYQGRVLLIASGGCAINCRYCFRRHFPYQDNQLGGEEWQKVLTYISQDSSIREVIFSGGDPLVSSDARLARLFNDLAQIPHLTRLRIHTRLPVVIPQRITQELLDILAAQRLQTVLVTHINHANEIDAPLTAAMQALKQAGVQLLNQTVLLKGVNDDTDSLTALSEALFAAGLLPYYLHLLDPVAGASHFDVDELTARRLVGELCDRLPGYLVPKLVRERAGASAKVPIMPVLGNSGIGEPPG